MPTITQIQAAQRQLNKDVYDAVSVALKRFEVGTGLQPHQIDVTMSPYGNPDEPIRYELDIVSCKITLE
jgi:hypothetical protein